MPARQTIPATLFTQNNKIGKNTYTYTVTLKP